MSILWQPRWIAGHVLVLVLVALFVRLGLWQLDRHAQHVERNELIAARLAEPALPIQQLLAEVAEVSRRTDPDAPLASSADEDTVADLLAFRRITAAGRYRPGAEVLLRNRTYQGRPGWHVLTPFVLEDAASAEPDVALIVDRGWVPQALDEAPVVEAAPPEGLVRLEGVLVPEQDPATGRLAGLTGRNPAGGPLERTFIVDVERLAPQLPFPLIPAYLVLTEQAPAQPGDLPIAPEPPAAEPASHLSYAAQWFIFALIGVVGYALLLSQRVREASRDARAAEPKD